MSKIKPEALPRYSNFQDLCVFLVEDNELLRDTITTQLEQQFGCTVFSAADGPSAIALQSKVQTVDIIICDMVLPNGMIGSEVISKLLLSYPDAAVIQMSGNTENIPKPEGFDIKNITLLQKPFTMKILAEVLENSLNQSANSNKQ